MNILSFPLLAVTGATGAGGTGGVNGAGVGVRGVGAAEAAEISCGSEAPPHAAMIAVKKKALTSFDARRLIGNSLIMCIVGSRF